MQNYQLNRRYVISQILKDRKNSLIINGLGGTCWDVASLGDNELNFYVWGGMGNSCMIALGLALSQPKRKVKGKKKTPSSGPSRSSTSSLKRPFFRESTTRT